MDEQAYRLVCQQYNPCPFEQAVLSGRCCCEQTQTHNIAEREVVSCLQEQAQQRCLCFLQLLQQKSRFALQFSGSDALPYGKKMKLQCGGMLGLQNALLPHGDTQKRVDNIFTLLNQAATEFGALENLPFPKIIMAIRAYKHRAHSS